MSEVAEMEREAASTARPLVEARGLTKHFGGGGGLLSSKSRPVRAVEGVDLSIAAGEVLGVVGESGSGKSTLGRLVLRLIEATEGTVSFDGTDLNGLSSGELRAFRRNMQMIFQDPFASLNSRMTIRDALLEPITLHRGVKGREAVELAEGLMQQVGLTAEQMKRYPRAFSGGQRQRVAIARALASAPRFIVADEPVSALDVSVQAEVVNLLQRLQRELGLSLMFISHDLSVVEIISDRVMVLYLGRVMEVAPTRQLYQNPAHPYTAALLQAVPGARSAEDRLILAGEIPSPANPPSGCVFRTRCPFAIAACAETVPELREVAPGQKKACIRDDLTL
ncbi:ATP-binding cassette domain-containing protein [Acuticoccus sp. M5D2P5]|uniref:ABC transporter ATP-binding protein n=1 Tax=Acuticoccus kalidii TaxID=2910977 RepID=UPI001F1EFC4F|nr:oligopeptide/dipeptide ABC transporter ATP-binding protein [Acuticoccus kalidii]MCF3936201.1 ATP-binding cassette domain-containing protein [Acuticoccus kalidii]